MIKGIIVNIRNGENNNPSDGKKKSQNVLISMVEELLSEKDAVEKKCILADEYGMIMTAELEGRIQIMCNLSENIIERERMDAIKRMIRANITREQILSMGYTEAEYKKAERLKESSKIKGGVTFPLIFWQLVMDLKFFDTALKGWSADYREVGRNLLLCF